jgi:serine/threonine protein kinase/Tol biopolymer transport system component
MPIGPGSRIGPYEVSAQIGEGGMGQVYRARDRTLNRDVALKILPEVVAVEPDRVARFKREAQLLAALNHPNIAGIYGLEESHAGRALVLELVEGPTLADRLARGPLAPGEALVIARQIAEAIEAAHEQGIIHRDLKPANVKVRGDGTVKVLDFGLAKALDPVATSPESSHSPTITAPAFTHRGVILGTAPYMSPEQAKGLPADQRSDIWAFGCVLYEMLAGRRPFPGQTISEILAQILEREPDLNALPASTPARIAWLVRRCLEKDPRRRLHDIADARIEIDEALREPVGSAFSSAAPMPTSSRSRWREALPWTAAAVCLAALVGTLIVSRAGRGNNGSPDARSFTAAITLPDGLRLGTANPPGRFALSPNGQWLAFAGTDATGRTQLWIRPLATSVAQPLAGTEDAQFPFWSPDSRAIAFVASRKLRRVDLFGGPPITIADVAMTATGAWNKDNVILFTPTGGAPLHRVSALGGTPVAVTTLDKEAGDVQHWYPSFLPDGKHFLYFAVGSKTGGATDARAVLVGSLDSTGPGKVLVQGGSNAKYANGHLLYSRNGTLVAQPFDLERLELRGESTPLVEQMQIAGFGATGTAGAFSVSDTGLLAYQAGSVLRSRLVWLDRSGEQTSTLGDPADYGDVMLSPDGARAAVSVVDPAVGTRDLWIFDLARGIRERLTDDPGDEFAPIWSRQDGRTLIFSSRRAGSIDLYRIPVTGGTAAPLWEDSLGKFASDWSADGKFLVYIAGGGIISRSDLWVLPVGGGKPAPILETALIESQGQFSPDGRWLAYMSAGSERTGTREVYVVPFPGPGERRQISTAGGGWPRWRRDGREIFFLALDDTLTAVTVNGDGARFEIKAARPLFKARPRPYARLDAYPYDVTASGQRFIVNTMVDEPTAAQITLVVNWERIVRR